MQPLWAQTNVARSALASNRYLLVVETSRAMKPRAEGVVKAVQELLESGMKGQLRPGDTLGVWTFNAELYTGRLPLQRWSAEAQNSVAPQVVEFLRTQNYEKQADLDKMLAGLKRLIQDSEFITVVLVSSGEETVHGTPFDEPINNAYQLWRDQQQKARMPFVTVLRASHGKLMDYALAAAPWPLEMPPLPVELKLAELAEKKPAAKISTLPPLIVHGKKPEPEKVEEAPSAAEVEKAVPAPAAMDQGNALTVEVSNAPALAAVVPSKLAATITQAKQEPVPAPAGEQQASSSPANPAVAKASSQSAASPVSSLAPAQGAVATAAPPAPAALWQRKDLWLAGLLLAGGVFGLGFVLVRRSRPAPQASLITRSLERENK